MSHFLKKLVSLPVKKLAEYLLDRFLGKFVGKIDLNREGTTFNKETLTLPDLNLNCWVLNEAMAKTPLKFIKFHIGMLSLRVLDLRTAQVQITIKDVKIDLELQNETFAASNPFSQSAQTKDSKSAKYANANKQKELFLVDMLVSNVLTNLELSIENLAVRVVTREAKNIDDKIPTFLVRTHAISFQRDKKDNAAGIGADNESIRDKKADPLLPMSDLQCLLGNKKLAVSDISVHLMREKWLDPLEYHQPGQFNTKFNAFSFPFDYPTLNHPSTVLLLKAPLGTQELEAASKEMVKLREAYEFLPSVAAQFKQEEPGYLACNLQVPLLEVQLSISQLKVLHRFVNNLAKPEIRPRNRSQDGEGLKQSLSLSEDDLDSLANVKADFASNVLSQNPELMASMNEMFQSQQHEYLMYSSVCDNSMTGSVAFEPPPLIGKGDGYSQEAALKDSMHPDLLNFDASTSMMMQSQHGPATGQQAESTANVSEGSVPLSNMPAVTALPVKQPLNQIKVGFKLGELLCTILCSEDQTLDDSAGESNSGSRVAEDDLDAEIESIIDEQGARSGEAVCDSQPDASPFVLEHDRVFKAFGEQVNQEYAMQKFHLPARASHNEDLIKSAAYELGVKDIELAVQLARENDSVKSMKLTASVQALVGQRVDMILQTKAQKGAGELRGGAALQGSSMMDMTLLSNDSEKFHSCYSHNNSTVYHDMSQFGMASVVALGETLADPLMQPATSSARNVKNLFVFSQLTNVVNRFTAMGEFHICRTSFLEVVKLKKDTQKSILLTLQKNVAPQSVTAQTETKIFIGKIFLNFSDSELLLALSLKGPPSEQEEDQRARPESPIVQNPLHKAKTGIQLDGLEFDFRFSSPSQQVLHMLDSLTKKERLVQDVLAQSSCSCLGQKSRSLGLNTTQINFVLVSEKQPCLKLSQADLVAKTHNSSAPVSLCCIRNLIVRVGSAGDSEQGRGSKRRNPNDLSRISEESGSQLSEQSFNQTVMTIHRDQTTLTQHNEVLFHRTSSSYDETRDQDRLRRSFTYNPNMVHVIDEDPDHKQISVRVQQLAVLLDHLDLVSGGQLAEFIVEIEGQLKGLINVVDAVNVATTALVNDKDFFFIQKRNKIGAPIRILTCIDDLTIQTIYDDKEALKVRLDKSTIDFKMQDRGALTNFSVGVKLHDLLVIDQLQRIYPGLKRSQNHPSQTYQRPQGYLSFAQECQQASSFLLLHPSQESHARPMLSCSLDLSFLNQGFMEERIGIEQLRQKIDHLKPDLDGEDPTGMRACRQLAMDFGEMKKNPAQVVCTVLLNHMVVSLSNQNITLSQTISTLTKKVAQSLGKLRVKAGLAGEEGDVKLTPSESPKLDTSLEHQQLNLQVRDIGLLYTPVLARSKLSALNLGALSLLNAGGQTNPLGSAGDMVRLHASIALQLNHMKLELVPKSKSFSLELRSFALHFLTDNQDQSSSLLQGRLHPNQTKKCSTSQQELAKRGFVPLMALTDFQTVFQSKQMAVKLNQVTVSFAEDSLQDFVAFLRLVQVSISDDLTRFEDQLFDHHATDEDSMTELTTYQGSKNRGGGDLSMVREHSMRHEESLLVSSAPSAQFEDRNTSAPDKTNGDSVAISSQSLEHDMLFNSEQHDGQAAALFGEEHPFQKVRDGCDDMFTVSTAKPLHSSANPFTRKTQKVNLMRMIDSSYFAQPAESQAKIDLQRYRKIHILSEEMRKMVCSLAFSFELGSVRVTLFCGKDFDFSTGGFQPHQTFASMRSSARQHSQRIVTHSSGALARTVHERVQEPNRQTMPSVNRRSIMSSTVSQQSRLSRMSISGKQDTKEVMLLEDNYMEENDLAQENEQEFTRPRNSHRKHNLFAKFEVQDLIVTRRHFPDQVLVEELKQSSKCEAPSKGLKFKTFNMSARDFQIQFSQEKGSKYMLESPYSFRHHNILELSISSEKSYEKDSEEHSILIFVRPSKLSVNRAEIDFFDQVFKSTLAQSMGNLKMHTEDDFEIIDDQEVKETASQTAPNDNYKHRTTQLIRNLVIKETSLTLSLHVNKLLSFQNLTVPVKEFRLASSPLQQYLILDQAPGLPIPLVQAHVLKFYKRDIVENQKVAILKSLRPVHGLTWVGGSVLSPIYKPLISGYQFGLNGILVGLSEGFGDLYQLLADGTYDVGVYLVQANQ